MKMTTEDIADQGTASIITVEAPVQGLMEQYLKFASIIAIIFSISVYMYVRSFLKQFNPSYIWLFDYSDIPKIAINITSDRGRIFLLFLFLIFSVDSNINFFRTAKNEFSDYVILKFKDRSFIASVISEIPKNARILPYTSAFLILLVPDYWQNTFIPGYDWFVSTRGPFEIVFLYMIYMGSKNYFSKKYSNACVNVIIALVFISFLGTISAENIKHYRSDRVNIIAKSEAMPNKEIILKNCIVAMTSGKFLFIFQHDYLYAISLDQIVKILPLSDIGDAMKPE